MTIQNVKFSLASALALMACTGCIAQVDHAPAPDGAEVAGASQALNSFISSWTDCNERQKDVIEEAAALALKRVNGSDRALMIECLAEATLSGASDEVQQPEFLVRRLGEDLPTEIVCDQVRDGVSAHAGIGLSGREKITFDYDFINENSAERVAAVFLHEIAHNKGYQHPDNTGGPEEYEYTVPEQVEKCSLSIANGDLLVTPRGDKPRPNGNMVSEAQRRVTLAPWGDHSGSTGTVGCERSGWARALRGWFETGGIAHLSKAYLGCGDANGIGPLVNAVAMGGATDQPGYRFDLDCGDGNLLVGLYGTADYAIGPVCATAADVRARSARMVRGTASGNANGKFIPFTRVCPVGMAVKGASTSYISDYLTGFSVTCEDVAMTRELAVTNGPSAGRAESFSDTHQSTCPNDGAVYRLFGQTNAGGDTGFVTRIGGRCAELARDASGTLTRYNPSRFGLAGQGGWRNGGVNTQYASWTELGCSAASEVLVGLRVWRNEDATPTRITGVAPICARAGTWDGGDTTRQVLARRGNVGSTVSDLLCASKQFLIGTRVSHLEDRVSKIQVLCRQF